jgi:polar amino acid transport system substrate-binding protein
MSTHVLRRTTAVAAAALAALALAGCTPDAEPEPEARRAAFSQELHDRLPAEVRDDGTLTVLTSAGYAPVMFYAADGRTLEGSEPDLAAALGRVLGVDVEFVPAEFPTILDRLAAGEADLGMSGITDTLERQAKVDFVDYFRAGTAILVQHGNAHGIAGLEDLCGRPVSVGAGTTQELLAGRLQATCGDRPLAVTQSLTAADAMLELRAGTVQATLVDYPPAAQIASDPRSRSAFELVSDEQHEPAPFGIAVSRTNEGLAPVLQDAMSEVLASGEYADVLARWNLQGGAVEEITLNAGT